MSANYNTQLNKLINIYSGVQTSHLDKMYDWAKECAEDVSQCENVNEAELAQLRQLVQQLSDAHVMLSRYRTAVGQLRTITLDRELMAQMAVKNHFEALVDSKTPVEKPKYLADFDKFVEENRFNPELEDPIENFDEDVVVQKSTANFNCPLSLKIFENPLRNNACKHVYSRRALEDHLRQQNSNQSRCPVNGCSKMVSLASVVPDEQMVRRVKRFLRDADVNQGTQTGFSVMN